MLKAIELGAQARREGTSRTERLSLASGSEREDPCVFTRRRQARDRDEEGSRGPASKKRRVRQRPRVTTRVQRRSTGPWEVAGSPTLSQWRTGRRLHQLREVWLQRNDRGERPMRIGCPADWPRRVVSVMFEELAARSA